MQLTGVRMGSGTAAVMRPDRSFLGNNSYPGHRGISTTAEELKIRADYAPRKLGLQANRLPPHLVCLNQAPDDRRELAEVIEESQRGKHCLVIYLHIEMNKQIALPSGVAKPLGNLG